MNLESLPSSLSPSYLVEGKGGEVKLVVVKVVYDGSSQRDS